MVNFTFLPLLISIERVSVSQSLKVKVQHRYCSTKGYFTPAFNKMDNSKITILVYDLLSQKFKIKSL